MVILHVIHNLGIGGAQVTLYNLSRMLVNIEHIIITYQIEESFAKELRRFPNIKVIKITSFKEMMIILKNMPYDIVHYHWWPQIKVCYHFFRQQKKPIIISLQEQCEPPKYEDVYYVAGSLNNFQYLKNMKNKKVIYLGIDPNLIVEKSIYNSRYFNIGRVSTIIPSKIPDNLIDVFKSISIPSKQLKFYLYGKGDANIVKKLQEQATSYPEIDLHIDTDPYVADKYQYLDAFVYWLPEGSTESFGLVIIEAMLSGVPVIAHRAGAIPEIITHGKNGFLFESTSEIQMYIEFLIKDEDLRNKITLNAKKTVLNSYTVDIMVDKYYGLYNKVLNIRRENYD